VAGATAQSAETLLALKLVWGPGAALFILVTLLVFRRFPIDRVRHLEIQRQLAERHLREGGSSERSLPSMNL
jgi:Na+/melibiose symporter-like transporter